MPKIFLTNLDVSKVKLIGMTPDSGSTDPSTNLQTGRIFYNTTANALKFYNGSAWSNISSGGGGGSGSVASVNSLTGALTIQGTTNHITATSGGTTITFDTDPSVVFTASSQTLTNKTLTSPVISTIVNTGTLTLPTSTDTLVGKATTDILTNKSLSAASVNAGSFSGNITNTATISGGTFSGVTLSGTTTNTGGTISSGSLSNVTIAVSSGNTITGLTNSNLSGAAGISNANLANSAVTVGSTSISLGATQTAIAGLTSITSTSVVGTLYGNVYGNATGIVNATNINTASTYVLRDANGNAQFSTPVTNNDAATKSYVDNVAQGLNTHDAVQAATNANLSAVYANGTADASGGLGIGAILTLTSAGPLIIDGVNLTVNDRVLVKNQTTQFQNGLYTVTASGSTSPAASALLTRALDGDNSTAGEMSVGDFVFVLGGNTASGTGWTLNSSSTTGTQPKSIKIGTDSVQYAQFSQGFYNAGTGLSMSGNTISFNPSVSGAISNTGAINLAANSGLTISANALAIGTGTGLTVSAGTLSYSTGTTTQTAPVTGGTWNYGIQKQVVTLTGTSSTTVFGVSHNLNSRDVVVRVYQTSITPDTQWADAEVDITRNSTSSLTIGFATAPATNDTYNVVIVG